jgi:hypothetical protein
MLEDSGACGRLSWGSAILVSLYRSIYQVVIRSTQKIWNPMILFQVSVILFIYFLKYMSYLSFFFLIMLSF